MKSKLVMLNLMLAALLAGAGWKIRERWIEAKRHEAEVIGRSVPATPAPAIPAAAEAPKVQAAGYVDVAARMLFSKDRNPTVVIEAPKPKPEPVMPVVHGVMDLGFGATVFMSDKAGAPQKGYKTGDKVGEWVLAKATRTDLEFEWEGKTFKKTVAELKAKPSDAPAAAQAAPTVVAAAKSPEPHIPNETTSEEKLKDLHTPKSGTAWVDVGGTNHACAPGDSAPAGTVFNGYRKVMKPSPFGTTCYWEPAR